MKDSSQIILNNKKVDNFIHARVAVIGPGSYINGRGKDGMAGKAGVNGYTVGGPCKDGIAGSGGTAGTAGQDGVNLFLYFDELVITGNLSIEISGGDGGDGGRGGNGGGGSPGTRLCAGGDGAQGATGGGGGNAGNGGNLVISCKNCPDLRAWLNRKIKVRTYRGNTGLGGDGGLGGLPGLGVRGNPNEDGAPGIKGNAGAKGAEGKDGAINFEKI
jgi:hypothetical protein